jgi:hypothetical protein
LETLLLKYGQQTNGVMMLGQKIRRTARFMRPRAFGPFRMAKPRAGLLAGVIGV